MTQRPLLVMAAPVMIAAAALGGCTPQSIPLAPPGGTYLSESAGASFDQRVNLEGEEGTYIANLSVQAARRSANHPQTIYLAAGSAGVVVSVNGGETWKIISVPLTSTTDVVVLGNDTLVVVGTGPEGQGYILRSLDAGLSWQTVLTIPIPVVQQGFQFIKSQSAVAAIILSLELDPLDSDRVYAGSNLGSIFVGEQSAKVWRNYYSFNNGPLNSLLNQQQSIRTIYASPHRAGLLYVLTADRSLWRVENGQQQKVMIPKGRTVYSVSFILSAPEALFVGVEDGAVISRDGGATWKQLDLPVDTSTHFNSVVAVASPTNPARLLVGINSVIYRSEDGGATWSTFDFGLADRMIISVLIDPTNASRVLAVTTPIIH